MERPRYISSDESSSELIAMDFEVSTMYSRWRRTIDADSAYRRRAALATAVWVVLVVLFLSLLNYLFGGPWP